MRALPLSLLLSIVPLALAAQQAPIVAAGDAAIDGSRIVPGTTTRTLTVEKDGARRPNGSIVDVISVQPDGRLLRVQTIATPTGTIVDTAISDRRTLVPVRHSSSSAQRTMHVDFAGAHATGTFAPKDSATRTIDQQGDHPFFDSNIYDLVVGALPLADGYAARVPVYIYERGGQVWMDVRVMSTDRVAGVAAWKTSVTLGSYACTMWLRKSDGHLMQLTAAPAPGVVLSMVADH